jgi:hypothetical protein
MRRVITLLAAFSFALVAAQGCSRGGSGGSGQAASTVAGATATAAVASAATNAPASVAPLGSSEYIELTFEDTLAAADISALLDQTVGAPAASGATPASSLPLRNGIFVTATPQGSNVILRFDANAAGVRTTDAYVEVAVSQDLGATFSALCQTAMATAALTSATPGLAQPWNLYLHAESPTGGICEVGVAGDSNGNFTLSWKIDSPSRAIAAFGPPSAFDPAGNLAAIEKVGGTVHFPIDINTFKVMVNRAYGYNVPTRFSDFALIPHAWLHLTVTADASNTVVMVRFDAITTSGARLYVAEAPASTSVGGRFFDETTARMQEMLDAEAKQPGSSKHWGTSFYYADVAKGVVDVVVKGQGGLFDIAYAVETPVSQVSP